MHVPSKQALQFSNDIYCIHYCKRKCYSSNILIITMDSHTVESEKKWVRMKIVEGMISLVQVKSLKVNFLTLMKTEVKEAPLLL